MTGSVTAPRVLLWFAVLLLAALPLAAPCPAGPAAIEASFERGVALYEEGDFAGAAEVFAEILATGVDDPVVHYNLANATFKSGRLGRAIYHYRRARALAPRDEDIAANLDYARFLALDAVQDDEARTDRRVEGWLDRVTPEEVFAVVIVLALLSGVTGVLWQLVPRGRESWRRSFVALIVLWAVCFAGGLAVQGRAAGGSEAVVLALEAEVRNGPGESFATAFVLHEGAEVVVEGERGAWTEVSLPGELRGWIASAAIARL